MGRVSGSRRVDVASIFHVEPPRQATDRSYGVDDGDMFHASPSGMIGAKLENVFVDPPHPTINEQLKRIAAVDFLAFGH